MAGVVLVTSGPLAQDGDDGLPAQVATSTESATGEATATAMPAEETATPAATLTVQLDADGWPVVECAADLEPARSPTRKITVCAPVVDFTFTPYERKDPGYRHHNLLWTHEDTFDYFVGLLIVPRDDSGGSREAYQAACKTDEPSGSATLTSTTLLGFPAEQCIWRSGDESKPVIGNQVWGVEQFAELPDYWIIANATGPQLGDDADAALELALDMFASARAAGLERQP